MILLERQFLNGRDRLDSCIRLSAHWVDGWKFKDNKWKYEEEERLPHVGKGWFRCRIHFYASWGTGVAQEIIQRNLQAIDVAYDIEGVSVQFCSRDLFVTVPLDLYWSRTDNVSKNPKIFRRLESLSLPIEPTQVFGLEILITYRNLNELLFSQRMFTEDLDHDGYRWVGSVPLVKA